MKLLSTGELVETTHKKINKKKGQKKNTKPICKKQRQEIIIHDQQKEKQGF